MQVSIPAKVQNRFVSTRKVKNAIECYIWDQENDMIETYYQIPNNNQNLHEYSHFRFVLDKDGALWSDANLFLLYKVKDNPKLSPSRMKYFVDNLTKFKEFCDNYDTDYLKPVGFNDTPTHRYRNYLEHVTDKTPKAAKRCMQAVTIFYEWMFEYNGFSTPFPLWKEKIVPNKKGWPVKVKDVCQFIGEKHREPTTSTYVTDEEHLRPLSDKEQNALLDALARIGNPEYTIIFYIALESMARKQTILTLRLHHFVDSLPESYSPKDIDKWFKILTWPSDVERKTIMVGLGQDADSKKGRYESYPIYIFGWLWKRIIVYIVSQRAFKRRSKALPQDNELKQYVFLTQSGHAMYHAKNYLYYNDIAKTGLNEVHEGNCLDQWISGTLKKTLKNTGNDFEFWFHCIRATAAKNFLEMKRKANGEYTNFTMWRQDIEELAKRMNHSSTLTTEGYLHYLIKNEQLPKEAEIYEATIEKYATYYDGVLQGVSEYDTYCI